jgi:hypothetical protein
MYVNVNYIHDRRNDTMTGVMQRLDAVPRPFMIGFAVLGFIVFWPIGLAVLAYLFWSGRMGCANEWRGENRQGNWVQGGSRPKYERWERKMANLQDKMNRWSGGRAPFAPTGNAAFDEYREEALRKLEDEAKEFQDFLTRLRKARDKAEFDQYMADRGAGRPGEAGPTPSPTA